MSQPHKRKPKEARKVKEGTKTDSAKSKPGASMSTRSSEEKTKVSEPVKVESSKPMSSTSKSSGKPGSAAAHKSADTCKSKKTPGSSAVSSGAAGVKLQQPQTTATHQSKMGQKVTKTSKLDAKESLAGTVPTKVAGTSLHKNNDSKIQDGKPMLSALEQLMEPFASQGRDAPVPKCTGPAAKDKDPLDLLAETLPSEAPDNSAPKYTGPEVKESDVTKKKGKRVGEREDTIPPDYRFKDQPDPKQDKGKPTSFSADPGAKPKTTEKSMTEGDVLDSLSADFVQSSAATVSKSSATSSHSAAPPSTLKQAPLQASTAATVSTSQAGDKDKDPFDLLADTLPSEAPDQSAPKYTGPPVKESDLTKQQIERMGEREDTLPPDYRFKEQPDPKDKGQPASSTGPGAKPKTMTESDVLESLSADFVQSSPATIPKCSAAASHSAAPTLQQQAPLQASKAASVSASQTGKKDDDPFDVLAQTLPSEAPDQSAPKYTGPPVKESDATKKQIERVGEREDTIPPDYRFKEQPDPKGKGPLASSASPGAKPKTMPESDVLESLSADFVQGSPAIIPKCSAAVSHSAVPPSLQQQAPLQASTAASVSASQSGAKDKDAFDLLAETLPSEAPDDSAPKYTGPEVKESDATKKKAERVGEREDTLPPDYRFKEQPTPKDKLASSSTGTGAKPKTMTESDVLDSLSADFVQSSSAPVSKCSAATSHAAAPSSMQKEAPLQASAAAPVSAGRTCATGKDAFDLLADTLPSEAPDNSAPKYTGPAVKEPDATKKKGERVGERDDTIPPDYRFKEQPDPKDKGNLAPSFTGPGAKPKVMPESDVLESLSADFVQSSAAPISKCSATTSQSAAPPSMQKEAPLKASTAASVSASQTSAKDKDAFDLLAETLPSEAPDNSAPKYTGPEVKESDATKKLIERVGERDDTLPPDYRFGIQADPKDKGKPASSFTSPGAKPKTMAEGDVLDSLSADFVQSSAAPISKCSATVAHAAAPPSKQKQEPEKASAAASVSASQSGLNDKAAFDLLAETLPSEAPDTSAPKYTGPAVKESDSSKKKAERVGETEESIPPDYRFTGQADPKDKGKSNLLPSSTGAGTKPKTMTDSDVLESLSADLVSAAPISKCSAAVSHSVAPPSLQQQAPLQASTVASVSASQSGAKDDDAFDLLAQTLPSEAPDNSAPKYTGPPVKESDVSKKKAERVGETEESIPPDYRFTEKTDPKQDKGKLASSSTDPGAKPKLLTKAELVDTLSSDFDGSSSPSHSAAQISKQKETKEKSAAKSDTKKARKH